MAMTLRLSAAVVPPQAPPIGQPGCKTTCGNVSVPYPFGFGPSRCYWQGLNLTCDTSHGAPPRLLLCDGTLRRPCASCVNTPFGRGFMEHGYLLSYDNELIVFGCKVVATLLADAIGGRARIGGCTSLGSDTTDENKKPVNVFVAEKGWINNMSVCAHEVREIPFILMWSVTRDLPPGTELHDRSFCADHVRRMLCKSRNSICWNAGNPYLAGAGGCKG
nr:unnamed protein product [Digitaria exilis]